MLNKILQNLKNFPDDECYQIKDRIYKNKELYKYICNIYEYIIKQSKCKNVLVYGHKEIYMIATFLACSLAGKTYIPIDESIPDERIKKIKNQVSPIIVIDRNIEKIMDNENPKPIDKANLSDNDIYYIIFTSGSTGEPKGVKISYQNIKSCMNWLKQICNINQGTILNQANFSFDLSVADIYLSLLTRSKHYILEKNIQNDYKNLFGELKNSNANLAIMTPSFAEYLLIDKSFNKELMPNLKKILFCGENLKKNTVSKLFDRFEDLQIINCYGPTECTFAVTSTIIKNNEEISIGIPKKDVQIHIVDKNLEEVKDGTIGEILISGKSVGKGYVDERLNKNTFIIYNGEKSYLTGDLGYKKNNKFYYIGRKDRQIKYKGYRIELSEIENVIRDLDYVENVIITTKGKSGKAIAFVKEKDGEYRRKEEIKKHIKKYLPEYMLPIIKIINYIPLNENGKVDEEKLIKNEGTSN